MFGRFVILYYYYENLGEKIRWIKVYLGKIENRNMIILLYFQKGLPNIQYIKKIFCGFALEMKF
jgi:hypothetical protein